MVTFGEVAQQVKTKVKPADTDLDRYVGLEHLDPESLRIRRWGVPEDVTGEKIVVRRGDIIFGKRRSYQRKVVIADFDCICSAHAMVLQPKEDVIIKEIFPFFLQSDQFMNRAVQISVGGLSPTINWKDLARQEFPLPPIDEQRRIAEILWAAEDVIVKNEAFVAEMEHYKQLMMRDLFRRGIGHEEFREVKKVGMVPVKWNTSKLRDICELITKGATPTSYGYRFQNSGINFIKAESISEYNEIDLDSVAFIDYDTNKALKRSILQKNDILFTIAGALGRVALVNTEVLPANTNQAVAIIRLDPRYRPRINLDYIMYYLTSSLIRQHIEKTAIVTAQPNINLSHLREFTILMPSLLEQQKITAILSSIDDAIAAARTSVEASKALKMRLISQLLSPPGGDRDPTV